MKKICKVSVSGKTRVTIDYDGNEDDDTLLDKVENELDKGYVFDDQYFEIEAMEDE